MGVGADNSRDVTRSPERDDAIDFLGHIGDMAAARDFGAPSLPVPMIKPSVSFFSSVILVLIILPLILIQVLPTFALLLFLVLPPRQLPLCTLVLSPMSFSFMLNPFSIHYANPLQKMVFMTSSMKWSSNEAFYSVVSLPKVIQLYSGISKLAFWFFKSSPFSY